MSVPDPAVVDWVPLGGVGVALGYGISLPASPVNGQEAILVDSVTAPTYQWRFRYNASSTYPDKWEFIGGSPALVQVDAGINITSLSHVASGGPTFTLPRKGGYIVAFGARAYHQNQAGGQALMALFVAGTLHVELDSYQGTVGTLATNMATHQFRQAGTYAGVAATVLECQYKCASTGTATFASRWLSVIPQRVS